MDLSIFSDSAELQFSVTRKKNKFHQVIHFRLSAESLRHTNRTWMEQELHNIIFTFPPLTLADCTRSQLELQCKKKKIQSFHPSKKFQAIAGSGFLNVRICTFYLSFVTVNEESLGFGLLVDKRSNLKTSLRAQGNREEHFSQSDILINTHVLISC